MGTRVAAVIASAPQSASLAGCAAMLSALSASSPQLRELIVHVSLAHSGPYGLLWCELDDTTSRTVTIDEVAQLLSRSLQCAVALFVSDSLGEAGYAIFQNGTEVGRNDAPIAGAEPLYPRFVEGVERAFPGCGLGSPEEALDLFYGPDALSAAFVVGRSGQALTVPEPFAPPPPIPRRSNAFDGEFAWGRKPRALLQGCLWVFLALGGLLVLTILTWFLVEYLRSR